MESGRTRTNGLTHNAIEMNIFRVVRCCAAFLDRCPSLNADIIQNENFLQRVNASRLFVSAAIAAMQSQSKRMRSL